MSSAHAFRLLRDAGVARRAIQLVGERARRQLPGQRVLAAARADQKDVHAAKSLAWPLRPRHAPSTASTGAARRPAAAWFASPDDPSAQNLGRRCCCCLQVSQARRRPIRSASSSFHSYKMENRPTVVFPPPPKGGSVHMSPYPIVETGRRGLGRPTSAGATAPARPAGGSRTASELGKIGPEACRLPARCRQPGLPARLPHPRRARLVNLAF